MEPRSVDDLLTQQQPKPQEHVPQNPVPQETKPANDPVQIPDAANLEVEHVEKPQESVEKQKDPQEQKSDSKIDEYGNEITVKPQKTYSEEDVYRMMKERDARRRTNEPKYTENQPVQPQTPQPSEDEPWDVTLQKFVDNAIDTRQKKAVEENWKREQMAIQAQFEDKFTNGMNKYSDFREVVSGKNVTDSMMLATRHFDNPAAFIYGAAKMHPQELDRISKISDPYLQAAEVGRLHEKMIKSKNIVSNAPKPIEISRGDMPVKDYMQKSIEDRIREHALSKRK